MSAPNNTPPLRAKPNYTYAIISVALVLFLLGFFGLVVVQARQLVNHFKENILILVELNEGRDEAQTDSLADALRAAPFVKRGTLSYTNKDEALQLLKDDFGDDFMQYGFSNPLYDMFSFNVPAGYLRPDSLDRMTAAIKQNKMVSDVFYREQLVQEIGNGIGKFGWIGLTISFFLVFVAAALIHNTVKLAIYSNRFLIKNMQLVGASWDFISRPYIQRSMRNGLYSAISAIVALSLLLLVILKDLPELKSLQSPATLVLMAAMLVALGIGISTYSTYRTVKKYLRARIDDLY
jgi:cell division transport system permease protein